MIKRLIWTIWTTMSSVLKKADKLNLSLSLSCNNVWVKILWISIRNIKVWSVYSWEITDDKTTLVQVMAWRHQATSHWWIWFGRFFLFIIFLIFYSFIHYFLVEGWGGMAVQWCLEVYLIMQIWWSVWSLQCLNGLLFLACLGQYGHWCIRIAAPTVKWSVS